MTAADEAATSYAEELEELTFNSKPIINSLTMIAEELAEQCPAIVRVIEKKTVAAAADKKLPLLYLLDSICKNVGGAYVQQFALNLPALIGSVYEVSGPKVRNSLHALIKTWNGVFPPNVVEHVNARVASVSSAGVAPVISGAPMPQNKLQPLGMQPAPFLQPVAPQGMQRANIGGLELVGRKRTREVRKERGRNPAASIAALRTELHGLMGQLRVHVQSGTVSNVPPQQWAARTSQAHELCAQLMSQVPEGSHDFKSLSALQSEISIMQGLMQPPPPPPLKPAATAPVAPAPVAASLDVNKLLASLAAGGLLPTTSATPLAPTQLDYTGSAKAMLYRMYEAQPLQCKTCGLRFDEDKREDLRQHMDWHFRLKMRGKGKGKVPLSRRWFLGLEDWLKHKPSQDTDVESSVASVFDSLEGADVDSAGATRESEADVPVLPVPDDVIKVICFQCGEDVPSFWEATKEAWMLRDAVYANDGSKRICHSACVGP